MWARWLADGVVLFHFTFVVFVVFGGFLAVRRRRLAWIHLPCAAWGFLIEVAGWICPLTYLENDLRRRAGRLGYPGGFIEHYLEPILYPEGLDRDLRLVFAGLVVLANAVAYGWVLHRWRRDRRLSRPPLPPSAGGEGWGARRGKSGGFATRPSPRPSPRGRGRPRPPKR